MNHLFLKKRQRFKVVLLLSIFLLYGCSSTIDSPYRTLQVQSPQNAIASVYIDTTFIGNTPLSKVLNQDSVDGAQLQVVYQGEIILSRRLKKESNLDMENKKTALGVAAVTSGALMLALPFSWAIFTPAIILPTSYVLASVVTPDSL